MQPAKIAVAGCGPAGLASALLLHRDGHSVEIFERFPEPSPVGSGLMLQPTGLAVLETLGLAAEAFALGTPIHRLSGKSAISGRQVLDVRYSWLGPNSGHGLGIHRSNLFDILFRAATRAGIPVQSGWAVSGSELTGNGRVLIFENHKTSRAFDLVVDALGMRSPLAGPFARPLAYGALWSTVEWPSGAGFDGNALEQRYVRASIMAGMMPTGRREDGKELGTFFWSLKGADLDAWKATDLEIWRRQVCKTWPAMRRVLDQISSREQLSFAQYVHRTLPDPVGERLFHLGDSWHSTSPQLGQGANMALLDAYALAQSLANVPALPEALKHAARLRRLHVRIYQAMSLALTPFHQSDSRILPAIRDLIVPHAAKLWPTTLIQAAMVSGLIGNPLARLGLVPAMRQAESIEEYKLD